MLSVDTLLSFSPISFSIELLSVKHDEYCTKLLSHLPFYQIEMIFCVILKKFANIKKVLIIFKCKNLKIRAYLVNGHPMNMVCPVRYSVFRSLNQILLGHALH